jgi:hypothetical protein
MPNQIKVRFPGACKTCGVELAKGAEAWHFKDEKKIECPACHASPPTRSGSIPPPTPAILDQSLPGESARREYKRRSHKRQDELQGRWGSKLGKVVWLLEDEKQSTATWAKGAKGEQKVGAHLEKKLDGSGCEVLHDRGIPGSRANIDHIVIGPAGATVIDAKNIKGDCRAKTTGIGRRKRTLLIVGGRDRTKLIHGVVRQIEVVSAVLARADFGFQVDVAGMLCWWRYEGLPLIGTNKTEIDGVKVMNPNGTARYAGREGPLELARIQVVANYLDEHLRPA